MTIKSILTTILITVTTAVLIIFGYNNMAYSHGDGDNHHMMRTMMQSDDRRHHDDSNDRHMGRHHDDSNDRHMGRHHDDSDDHHMGRHHDDSGEYAHDKKNKISSISFLNKLAQQKVSAMDTFNKLQLPKDEKIIGYKIGSNQEAIVTTVYTYNTQTLTRYTYRTDSGNDTFIKNSHKSKSKFTPTKLDLKQVLQIVLKKYNNSKVILANLNKKKKQYVVHLLQSENNIISRQKLLVDADSGEIVSK